MERECENMVPPIALVSGISACMLIATGWIAGWMCIIRYLKEGAQLLLMAGILLILVGSFYLGTVVSFILLITTGSNIDPGYLGAQLCYSHAPIASALSLYLGFSIINKEKLAKIMPIIYMCTAPIFWWGLLFNPESTITADIPLEGGEVSLVDFKLGSYVMILVMLYLLSFLIFTAGAFYWMASKSSGKLRRKFYELAIGFTGFVAFGAIDSLVDMGIWIFVPRAFMVVSYILMYMGFTRSE